MPRVRPRHVLAAVALASLLAVPGAGARQDGPAAPRLLAPVAPADGTVSVAWQLGSENGEVAGYGLYRNGKLIRTTADRAHTFSGLACGTRYRLGVDAFDAVGNRSSMSERDVITFPCPLVVAPDGSNADPCTPEAPCRTFNRAYRVARPGQEVLIRSGSYPYQQLDHDPTKTGPQDVVFQPAPEAEVFVRTLALGNGDGMPAASHVTVLDVEVGEFQAFTPAQDVTVRGVKGKNFYVRGVQGLLIEDSHWGPCGSRDPACGGNSKIDYPSGEQPNADITILRNTFRGYRIDHPEDHYECVFIASGTNIRIAGSRFWDCEFYDIFVQYTGGSLAGLVLENNWFDTPWNGQGVRNRWSAVAFSPKGTSFADVLVRYNSFHETTGVEWNDDHDGLAYSNVRAVGNVVGLTNACYDSVGFAYDVFADGTCGPTDRAAPPGYVNAAHAPDWDWHLQSGAAVDLVPARHGADARLHTDIDGDPRPHGPGYDASADELR